MLAQLEVKEINSRTSTDFQGLSRNFFSNSKTFQDFQGLWTTPLQAFSQGVEPGCPINTVGVATYFCGRGKNGV
jgi:hypothetical protein